MMKLDEVHEQLHRPELNTEEHLEYENLNQGLETTKYLLTDKQSPIVSTLQTAAQETEETLLKPFEI